MTFPRDSTDQISRTLNCKGKCVQLQRIHFGLSIYRWTPQGQKLGVSGYGAHQWIDTPDALYMRYIEWQRVMCILLI